MDWTLWIAQSCRPCLGLGEVEQVLNACLLLPYRLAASSSTSRQEENKVLMLKRTQYHPLNSAEQVTIIGDNLLVNLLNKQLAMFRVLDLDCKYHFCTLVVCFLNRLPRETISELMGRDISVVQARRALILDKMRYMPQHAFREANVNSTQQALDVILRDVRFELGKLAIDHQYPMCGVWENPNLFFLIAQFLSHQDLMRWGECGRTCYDARLYGQLVWLRDRLMSIVLDQSLLDNIYSLDETEMLALLTKHKFASKFVETLFACFSPHTILSNRSSTDILPFGDRAVTVVRKMEFE